MNSLEAEYSFLAPTWKLPMVSTTSSFNRMYGSSPSTNLLESGPDMVNTSHIIFVFLSWNRIFLFSSHSGIQIDTIHDLFLRIYLQRLFVKIIHYLLIINQIYLNNSRLINHRTDVLFNQVRRIMDKQITIRIQWMIRIWRLLFRRTTTNNSRMVKWSIEVWHTQLIINKHRLVNDVVYKSPINIIINRIQRMFPNETKVKIEWNHRHLINARKIFSVTRQIMLIFMIIFMVLQHLIQAVMPVDLNDNNVDYKRRESEGKLSEVNIEISRKMVALVQHLETFHRTLMKRRWRVFCFIF